MPKPLCVNEPLPEMAPANISSPSRFATSSAIVDDIADDRSCETTITDLQNALRDLRATAVSIVCRQDRRAGADMPEHATAGDRAAERVDVGAENLERAAVDDIANDRARRAASAELQPYRQRSTCRRCRCCHCQTP